MAVQHDGSATQTTEKKAQFLRIRVIDKNKPGQPAVNVRIPVGVAKWGFKMAENFYPKMKDANLDWDAISAMLQQGEVGKLVEVDDEAEHRTVEVWVE